MSDIILAISLLTLLIFCCPCALALSFPFLNSARNLEDDKFLSWVTAPCEFCQCKGVTGPIFLNPSDKENSIFLQRCKECSSTCNVHENQWMVDISRRYGISPVLTHFFIVEDIKQGDTTLKSNNAFFFSRPLPKCYQDTKTREFKLVYYLHVLSPKLLKDIRWKVNWKVLTFAAETTKTTYMPNKPLKSLELSFKPKKLSSSRTHKGELFTLFIPPTKVNISVPHGNPEQLFSELWNTKNFLVATCKSKAGCSLANAQIALDIGCVSSTSHVTSDQIEKKLLLLRRRYRYGAGAHAHQALQQFSKWLNEYILQEFMLLSLSPEISTKCLMHTLSKYYNQLPGKLGVERNLKFEFGIRHSDIKATFSHSDAFSSIYQNDPDPGGTFSAYLNTLK